MSQKPSSYGMGVSGTVGSAAQTVATTKYSVHTAAQCPKNKYGDRYAAIIVKSTQAYTLYVYGLETAFASVANTGAADGQLLTTVTGSAATALSGTVHYVRIAGFKYFAPVLYQASGSDATVTLTYQTFND